MPAEPTTEGSIVAYIRADNGDLNRGVGEARAKVAELTGSDTTLHVKADVASAVEKLIAVRQAMRQVATEQLNEQRASLSETAALRTLDIALTRTGGDAVKLAAAAVAATKAQSSHADATARLAAAHEALAVAERHAAGAALEEAAAEDVAGKSVDKAAARNKNNVTYMGFIVAAVAALVALGGPLTAFALGGAGALTGMGVAGIIAIKGISAELKAGTDLGNQYQAGINVLKDDLHQLEQTAASGVIGPFNEALKSLQPQMPRINQDMGAMAHWAGLLAGTTLEALVSGFQTMEPLLVAGEKLVQGWADNLQQFAKSPEFRGFIQYAVTQLPQVNSLLMNLSGVVVHVAEAFAPLANVAIPLLSAIAWGFNAIPLPVLEGLASGAGAVAISFAAWNYVLEPLLTKMGLIAPTAAAAATAQAAVAAAADAATVSEGTAAAATTAWGAALDFATGPAGIIIGIVAALAGGMFVAAQDTKAAAAAALDFATAIQADNGAMGEHVKIQAVKALQDSGAIDAARKLGISTTLVAQATLGNVSAQKELQAELTGISSGISQTSAKTQTLTNAQQKQFDLINKVNNGYQATAGVIKSNLDVYRIYQSTLVATGSATQALAADQTTLDNAMGTANTATEGYIVALEKWAKSGQTAADTGAFLGSSLVSLQGDWLSYDTSLANASYANYTLTQTFADQGKQVSQGVKYMRDTERAAIDLNTGLIDVSKSGAPALLSQLTAMQSAAQKAAAALYQHEVTTKGAGQAAADAATIFKNDTYDALVKDAKQLGITSEQATKLADRYFALPSDVITQLQTQGQSSVVQTLDGIGRQLAELTNHPWVSTLDVNGVPLSHAAYLAQIRLNDIKQIDPTVIAADAKQAGMTVDAFTKQLTDIPDPTITVTADTADAMAKLAGVTSVMLSLQKMMNLSISLHGSTNLATSGGLRLAFSGGGQVPNYRAAGGPIEAAYLASGGNPFAPRGTDTVPAMLTPKEFVVRRSSAEYNPPFIKAYNDNPQKALDSVAAQGNASGNVTVQIVNKSGAALGDLIEMYIVRNNTKMALQMQGGLA